LPIAPPALSTFFAPQAWLFLQCCRFANFAFWALLSLELTHFALLANNTVIKAEVHERCKVLTKTRREHFVILTFSDVIFTGECSF